MRHHLLAQSEGDSHIEAEEEYYYNICLEILEEKEGHHHDQ
jgi:hypothetical protein